MSHLSWSDSIRYCGMCRGSCTAQTLVLKAKRGMKLSSEEIAAVESYAEKMLRVVGTENKVVDRDPEDLSDLRLDLEPELVLHGDRARIVKRGRWLADEVTGCVVGKCERDVTLFPNPVVLVNDLARVLKDV